MSACLITGSGGLVGSECVRYFADKFDEVIGIDNNMRAEFFGSGGSVAENISKLKRDVSNYIHYDDDIRELYGLSIDVNSEVVNYDVKLIIHCASQPSHDWASNNPEMDFDINATGTLQVLEVFRKYYPEAVFIFMSSNKVYGDYPNQFNYYETEKRFRKISNPEFGEHISIDHTLHSVYGASKTAADIMVQEYGRYYGLKTVCFRAGCISGPTHAGVEAHGFLSYLMKCAKSHKVYNIIGYKGKQVRDNIHVNDLVKAFEQFYLKPKSGAVYNMGGGMYSNCSILEAIDVCNEITGEELQYTIVDEPRKGDHIYWISDLRRFKNDYPNWGITKTHVDILKEIYES